MPVMVRNREGGPAVFTDRQSDTHIEWAGHGDPEGGDVQEVPDHVLQNTHFNRAKRKGIFEVLDGDKEQLGEQAFAQQLAAHQERATAEADAIESTVDRTTEAPISIVTVDEKGKVTDLQAMKDKGSPIPLVSTGAFDEEGRPILKEVVPIIDAPGSSLPPQTPLT